MSVTTKLLYEYYQTTFLATIGQMPVPPRPLLGFNLHYPEGDRLAP